MLKLRPSRDYQENQQGRTIVQCDHNRREASDFQISCWSSPWTKVEPPFPKASWRPKRTPRSGETGPHPYCGLIPFLRRSATSFAGRSGCPACWPSLAQSELFAILYVPYRTSSLGRDEPDVRLVDRCGTGRLSCTFQAPVLLVSKEKHSELHHSNLRYGGSAYMGLHPCFTSGLISRVGPSSLASIFSIL